MSKAAKGACSTCKGRTAPCLRGNGLKELRDNRLLEAVCKLVALCGVRCHGHFVVTADGKQELALDVCLPDWLWQAGHTWRRSPGAALVLAHLQPLAPKALEGLPGRGGAFDTSYVQCLAAATGQGERPALGDGAAAAATAAGDPFSLAACFAALPARMREPELPPVVRAYPGRPSLLADLTHDVLLRVLSKLDGPSLVQVASSCRHLRAAAVDVPPGLKLSLFPHQRAAVRWMLQREGVPSRIPHPLVRQLSAARLGSTTLRASDGREWVPDPTAAWLPLWGNTASGDICVEEPPAALDFRGGLFCDEPVWQLPCCHRRSRLCCKLTVVATAVRLVVNGLGKTITAAALILKTQGLLPAAPPGTVWIQRADLPDPSVSGLQPGMSGRRLRRQPPRGYWLLSEAAASSAATLQAVRSGGGGAAGGGSGSMRRTRSSSAALGGSGSQGALAGLGAAGVDAAGGSSQDQGLEGMGAGSEAQRENGGGSGDADAHASQPLLPPAKRPRQGAWLNGSSKGAAVPADLHVPLSTPVVPSMAATSQGDSHGSGQAAQGNSGQEGGSSEESGGLSGGSLWVECHLCRTWRKVPLDYPVPEGEWFCGMLQALPEVFWRTCRDPQDPEDEKTVTFSCPGWLSADSGEGGTEDNVEYYRSLLAKHPGLAKNSASALRWLAKQSPEVLLKGFTIPREQRSVAGYGEVLLQLGGLGPVKAKPGAKRRRAQQAADNKGSRPQLPGGKGAGKHDWFSWRQEPKFRFLRLDVKALQLALGAGPEESVHRIYLSSATLVVVTPELIDHWLHQLDMHVQRHALQVAVVVSDGSPYGDAGDPRTPWELAWDCDLVITTFDYMSHKWDARHPIACSPLMQVHWLRVILDEGHKIGGLSMTNKLQMAAALHAERRWVMTGTPTPSSGGTTPVSYLQPLMAFLHEPTYSQASVWQEAIQAPFQARQEEGRLRLLALLQRCMIRASKQELWNLPRLHRKVTLLDFAPMHAQSYNGFVDIVRFNLITSDWYDPDHKESLLYEANTRRSTQTLRNLRLSCNVAGNCELQVLDKDLAETIWLILAKHAPAPAPQLGPRQLGMAQAQLEDVAAGHADPGERAAAAVARRMLPELQEGEGPARHLSPARLLPPLARGDVPLSVLRLLCSALTACGALRHDSPQLAARIQSAMQQGAQCERCGDAARVVFATPCCHLLCVECTSGDKGACPVCQEPYVMQGKDDPERLKHNPNPKWDVPVELIEWQPAYAQKGARGAAEGEWQANWASTQSTKCVHLLRRLLEAGAVLPLGPAGQRLREQVLLGREGAPGASSQDGGGGGARPGLTKAIVFTQFWEHMLLLQLYLEQHHVEHAVLKSSMKPQEKASELARFQHNLWCGVLLMDESGSVGLDLSFVSHIFLMEPIADQALEQQVVSRAHRMGARQDVLVETLAMKGTLEEAMLSQQAQQSPAGRDAEQAAERPVPGIIEAAAGKPAVAESPADAAFAAANEAMGSSAAPAAAPGGGSSSGHHTQASPGSSKHSKRKRHGNGSDWGVTRRRGNGSSPAGEAKAAADTSPAAAAATAPAHVRGGGAGRTGLRGAQQDRQRTEADRRRARNLLLSSLRPVRVAELAEFQDLPGGGGGEGLDEAGPSGEGVVSRAAEQATAGPSSVWHQPGLLASVTVARAQQPQAGAVAGAATGGVLGDGPGGEAAPVPQGAREGPGSGAQQQERQHDREVQQEERWLGPELAQGEAEPYGMHEGGGPQRVEALPQKAAGHVVAASASASEMRPGGGCSCQLQQSQAASVEGRGEAAHAAAASNVQTGVALTAQLLPGPSTEAGAGRAAAAPLSAAVVAVIPPDGRPLAPLMKPRKAVRFAD